MCTLSKYVKNESRMVSPEDIKEIHPLLNTDEILGGLYVPADGSVDPTGKSFSSNLDNVLSYSNILYI